MLALLGLSLWKCAMLAIVPLMAGGPERTRAWAAMMGGSVATMLLPYAPAYLMFDLVAGAVVLRRPAGTAQRMIALIFAGMAIFDIGFLIGGQRDAAMFTAFQSLLGWVQFAILLAWGLHDRFGHRFRGPGPRRGQAVARPGA